MARTLVLSSEFGEFNVVIETDRVRLTDANESFVVHEQPADRFSVVSDTTRWTMAAAQSGDSVWIAVDGYALQFTIDNTSKEVRGSLRDRDALTPPMPATVVRVQVKAGQQVEQGDTLLVLEAMKMELPIRAPRAGTVKTIRCAEGQLVQPGDALVDFD
jgi:3-methylcrotonyl-CoA carboxylase alpha subunit